MKIGIISDIHENKFNLEKALAMIKELGVTQLLCLGDMMRPGIAKTIIAAGIPTQAVWGNNDGEKVLITRIALESNGIFQMSDKMYAQTEIDGKKIFFAHYPDMAEPLAHSGFYDLVCYGHTHEKEIKKINNCVLLNPGELAASKTGIASFAIYDTQMQEAKLIEIPGAKV